MSAKINIHNYEAYLLDLMEGQLSAEDKNELVAFANAHPELEWDLNNDVLFYLPADEATSFDKTIVLKQNEYVEDEQLIAYLENTLSPEEKAAFEQKLAADAELKQLSNLYAKTVLSADEELVFENKTSLIKPSESDLLLNSTLAYVEGLLSGKDKIEFEKTLKQNKSLAAEEALFQKTILRADTCIVHPDKESLKKKARVFFLFSNTVITRIAAAILLLAGLVVVFRYVGNNTKQTQQLATKNKTTTTGNVNSVNTQTQALVEDKPSEENHIAHTENKNKGETKKTISKLPVANQPAAELNVAQQTTTPVQTPLMQQPKEESPALASVENTTTATTNQTVAITNTVLTEKYASAQNNQPVYNVAVVTEDDDEDDAKPAKKEGFWKRAVKVAHKANNWGLKSVDGEYSGKDKVFLSFNSISIEKK